MRDLSPDRLWESRHPAARAARAVLRPVSWVYAVAMAARNAAYDRRWLPVAELERPTVAIGNLTVGGTGKTPMAAWLVERATALGARPAVLLRGYGADEVAVHRILNPGAIVVPDADRVRGARAASALGATCFVLDDAFQHRRVARDADVVLVSADRHREPTLLPAGPWREPITALRRATHVVVTRKRASATHSLEVEAYLRRVAPEARTVLVHISPEYLIRWGGARREDTAVLDGATVLAISAVADPHGFERNLRDAGARVTGRRHRDHHRFSRAEAERLADEAGEADYAVCTLKDAVKIGPLWPPSAPPLWYLSQRVRVEQGAPFLDDLARRLASPPTPSH
ncbi:MAG: tetraacyldisaccharide 4'-kinase [Gemmatimonadota bacterium]|nr:tetraacyldisaccharide 4'-kinase [Gemmatimonadota bacterium]